MSKSFVSEVFHGTKRVGASVSKEQITQLEQMCEASKQRLKLNASSMIKDAGALPVLCMYQADGTPKKIAIRSDSLKAPLEKEDNTQDENTLYRRHASQAHELLSHLAFYKTYTAAQEPRIAPVMSDSRPLDKGKTQWHYFQAAVDFLPLLCSIHPQGISISAYLFDRGLWQSLGTRMQERHVAYHPRPPEQTTSSDEDEQEDRVPLMSQSELMDWFISLACSLHLVHTAFKWAFISMLANPKAGLKDLFLCMVGLRDSFGFLLSNLGSWLREVVEFEECSIGESYLEEFWTCLGVDKQWLPVFVRLNPRWDVNTHRLYVRSSEQKRDNLIGSLSKAILYIWKFRQFSDSRWGQMESCSRVMLASWCLGLDNFVAFVRKTAPNCEYYIHHYDRLSPELRLFCTVAGIAGFVIQAGISFLEEDDRIAFKLGSFQSAIQEELFYLDSLSDFVWDRLVCYADGTVTAWQLRSLCLRRALVAAGFIDFKVIRTYRSPPFHLCHGDVDDNLHKLMQQDERPKERITYKAWVLLRSGMHATSVIQFYSFSRNLFYIILKRHDSVFGTSKCIVLIW